MSRVEMLKCDGCDELMGEKEGAWLTVKSPKEELDLCLGCVVAVKRCLQDHRMSVPAEDKPKGEAGRAHILTRDCAMARCQGDPVVLRETNGSITIERREAGPLRFYLNARQATQMAYDILKMADKR